MTEPSKTPTTSWTPRIVAFFCNWCTYTAADLAGVSRMKHASNVRIIRLMCSGRVDPQFVLDALAKGADGVLIGGCHPNDCHYAEGNYKCLRRYELLQRMLADMGIESDRLRLEWISAAEGEKVKRVINEMVETVTRLGPLGIPQKFDAWDREMEDFAERIAAREAAAGGHAGHGTEPQTMEPAHV
ncbi:MAG: hydrogenase iron-sulfur subunit [Verrucomicrobia bacterium]|nr:hydrogenase iron-sulfur subunit [Verrucomicrobiota bacterium]